MEREPNERLKQRDERRRDFLTNATFKNTGGYIHRLRADGTMPLAYLSDGYSTLMGYAQEEVAEVLHDDYSRFLLAADLGRYIGEIKKIATTGAVSTIHYAVRCRNGELVHLSDTLKAKVRQGEILVYGTVENVTSLHEKEIELREMNNRLLLFNEAAPFGIVEMEIGSFPMISYMNSQMFELLGLGAGFDGNPLEYRNQNARIAIIEPDLPEFDSAIERALEGDEVVRFNFRILRRNGMTLPVSGWMAGRIGPDGTKVVRCSCFDVSAILSNEIQMRIQLCIDLLGPAIDHLVLINTRLQSAQAVYGKPLTLLDDFALVSFSLHHTVDLWVERFVAEDERADVRAFFDEALSHKDEQIPEGRIPTFRTQFGIVDDAGLKRTIGLTLMYIGDGVYLFGQRDMTATEDSEGLLATLSTLNKSARRLNGLLHLMSSGIIELTRLDGDMFRIDHAEGLACKYFNIPELRIEGDGHIELSSNDLVGSSLLSPAEFQRLLAEGYVELGPSEGVEIRDRARLSCFWNEKESLYHILVHNISESHGGESASLHGIDMNPDSHDIYIRTFGHFEVFVDGKPIAFNHAKSKELLAVLVDRRGGYVSSHDAISYLWEDEPANNTTLARFRKVAMRLHNILDRHGIGHIVETAKRSRRINTAAVRCDLYDYLWGGKEYENLFKGSYILDYTWGEFTLGELFSESAKRLPEKPPAARQSPW